MTSTGTVGFVPFMVMLALGLRAAWRARRGPAGMLPLALLVSALGVNLTGNWLAGPLVWVEFAYVLASDRAPSTASLRDATVPPRWRRRPHGHLPGSEGAVEQC